MTELNATAHHATAVALVEAAALIIDTASNTLAARSVENGRISVDLLDRQQIAAYDLAHAASAVAGSQVMLAYALHGEFEARLSFAYIADVIADLESRIFGRQDSWGVDAVVLAPFTEFVSLFRSPEFLELLADDVMKKGTGPAHLDDEFDLVRDTFHRFANDKIRPVAEHIHRNNEDIPESILQGMAEIGGFGLSVPEEYGGFAAGGESD